MQKVKSYKKRPFCLNVRREAIKNLEPFSLVFSWLASPVVLRLLFLKAIHEEIRLKTLTKLYLAFIAIIHPFP